MARLFPVGWHEDLRTMVFIDGENLAMRFAALRAAQGDLPLLEHVGFRKDVYVWTRKAMNPMVRRNVLRKYYFTSVSADTNRIEEVQGELKELGIEAPMVFKKHRTKGSKMVDISIATEMLVQVIRKNIDAVALVAGDEDYVPLIEAVKREGCRVLLWFLENGLSPHLKAASDYFAPLEDLFFTSKPDLE